jgi:predicted amidohydrolase YtcJ
VVINLLAIENARIMGSYERSCLIIEDGKIVDFGTSDTCEKYRGRAKFLDADGRVLIPGLVDSHMHLLSYALSMRSLDLRGIRSIDELREAVKSRVRVSKPGEWIIGHGWDQENFRDGRFPRKEDLDDICPENPLLLTRICLHAGVLNSRAMKELGIGKDLLFEDELYSAIRKVRSSIDKLSLLKAVKRLLSYGITEVHSMDASLEELRILKSLEAPMRVRLYLSEGLSSDDALVEGVKVYADGSFGARTAALREEYEDDPGNSGVLLKGWKEIYALSRSLAERGKVLAVHAIGDRALEEVIKALEMGASNLRIEHASLIPQDLLERLSKAKPQLIAVQPHFTISDWWLGKRLGERVKYAYRFSDMLEVGLKIRGSSDAPVEPENPWMSIEAALTGGELGVKPLSLDQALKIYSSELSIGSEANLTLLDTSPWSLNRYDISGIRASLTIVRGLVAYDPDGLAEGWPSHPIKGL